MFLWDITYLCWNLTKMTKLLLPVSAALLMGSNAFAAAGAAVDVTDVTGTIAAQLPSIALVGVAVLGVIVAIAAFKWVRRAI
jgi:hypothetical protein